MIRPGTRVTITPPDSDWPRLTGTYLRASRDGNGRAMRAVRLDNGQMWRGPREYITPA